MGKNIYKQLNRNNRNWLLDENKEGILPEPSIIQKCIFQKNIYYHNQCLIVKKDTFAIPTNTNIQ